MPNFPNTAAYSGTIPVVGPFPGGSVSRGPAPAAAERTVPVPPMPPPPEALVIAGPAIVSGMTRAQQQSAKLQAMCEVAWAAALRLDPPVRGTALTLTNGCAGKSPNGYLCSRHNDGWHEARNAVGSLLETWEIAAAKPALDGLAELEADMKKPQRIPDPGGFTGQPLNWRQLVESVPITPNPYAGISTTSGGTSGFSTWAGTDPLPTASANQRKLAINQVFQSEVFFQSEGIIGQMTAAQARAMAAIEKLAERKKLVEKMANEATIGPGSDVRMPAPDQATKAKFTNSELEQIYREVMAVKQQEQRAEQARLQAMKQQMANPNLTTQQLNTHTMELMKKVFGLGP